MDNKTNCNPIEIFSVEAKQRLEVLQTLADTLLENAEAVKEVVKKIDVIEATVNIKDCHFETGDCNSAVSLNGCKNSSLVYNIFNSNSKPEDYSNDKSEDSLENHEHEWEYGSITTDETCGHKFSQTRKCKSCPASDTVFGDSEEEIVDRWRWNDLEDTIKPEESTEEESD